MSTTKVEKSNLAAKKSFDEPEKQQSKFTIRCSDVVNLCISFVFTILVACLILFYINNNQQQNAMEIEKIVESVLDARGLKLAPSEPQNVERKRGYLDKNQDDDFPRKKRAVHDFKSQMNGETFE
jgi:hypothetical protein